MRIQFNYFSMEKDSPKAKITFIRLVDLITQKCLTSMQQNHYKQY